MVDSYYRELVKYLTSTLGDRHLASDVAHDAYLRVLERARQDAIEQPRAFLYRTAINLSIDEHRRRLVRRSEPLEVLEQEEGPRVHSPQTTLYQKQRLDMVERALEELPAVCRDAFLLRKIEGMAHGEIAERLDISKGMVEKHIVNAMKHCRLRIQEWGG
ncbi:sigma-70 family RNA polymerase sigma factor [Metapseudomonas resinovorans]|uniref:RNA polymerase ECF-type sigma factor FpvI n=1 Tax=Metapseudomonas resinovorans NBRC 106553 TaxID=1245471 RepID=S6AEG7_METRE|nr:sigma-70 family RNA polymerase sigma factor [Pseudomonas resinovorans]BAN48027.1 RNA polymerase ECF-type sigma factor FpvI [Pseudomonas resinovorans NBRC 106553]